jgi:predicted secreted protein
MATKAQLLLSSVRVPATQDVTSLMASTNQVLLSLNTQLQQISNAFTLTKPTITKDATTGGITVGNIVMGSTNYIQGGATGFNTGTGFWLGYDSNPTAGYKFFIGSASGNKLTWDGSALSITGSITATSGTIGGWTIGSNYIKDTAGVVGLSSAVTSGDDVRIWAGGTTLGTAPFRVHESGILYATSGTVGGWIMSTTTLTAGGLALDATQNSIKSGQTDYATGTGFWLGYTGSTPLFSIGSTSNYLKWDGSNLLVEGGSGSNKVYIDTNGFTVGVANQKRVVLGTFGANPASLNFYSTTSPSTSRLGVYLNSGTTPTVSLAFPSGATLDMSANSTDFAITGSTPTYGSLTLTSAFGSPILDLAGPTGTLGVGPYFSLSNSSAATSMRLTSTGLLFTNDTNLYRSAANVLKTDDTLSVAGAIWNSNGGSAAPSYTFAGETSTGFYWRSSGNVGITCSGSDVLVVRTNAVVCLQPLKLNNAFQANTGLTVAGYVTIQDSTSATYKVMVAA